MLKPGTINREQADRPGVLAAHAVQHALASGWHRDEAVIAFGSAAKALAAMAAEQGNATLAQCAVRAWPGGVRR